MHLRERWLWVAALVAFELLALWHLARRAPYLDSRAQDPQLRLRQSPANARRCLSPAGRDARFVRRGACVTTAMRAAALADLVFELSRVLVSARVAFWLDSGSLLGQQRAGGVIPWDANADVGVLRTGRDALRVIPAAQLPGGYELYTGDGEAQLRFVERTHGFYVNVVVFEEDQDEADGRALLTTLPDAVWSRCEQCETVEVEKSTGRGRRTERLKRFRIPRDWVFPLRTCTFERFQVTCPAQPDKYLTHLYGENYLDPIAW